jgi:dTDP-4-dehydrorhamnose reductase
MVWLVGNRGMLGTEIEAILVKRGFEYLASDREVDITDFKALNDFIEDKSIDWIVNCAAYTDVDKAEDDPDTAYAVNAQGPQNLAKIAGERRIKFIHLSTDYVFDGNKREEYLETDEPNPLSVYGKGKLKGEEYIRGLISEYYIIRVAWLFGKHGENFVYTMLQLFNDRDLVRVVSDQFGSPTYCYDLAELIVKIIQDDEKKYGVYHFTNRGVTSWYMFAKEIYRLSREYKLTESDVNIVPVGTNNYPTRAERPINSSMSKEKIERAFDIEIPSWQYALRRFLHDLAGAGG